MGGKASGCSVTSAVTVPSMVPVACDHKGGALASSRPKVRLSAQAPFRRLSHVIHEPPLSKESNWQTQGWLPRGGAAPNCQNACLYTTKPTLIGGVKSFHGILNHLLGGVNERDNGVVLGGDDREPKEERYRVARLRRVGRYRQLPDPQGEVTAAAQADQKETRNPGPCARARRHHDSQPHHNTSIAGSITFERSPGRRVFGVMIGLPNHPGVFILRGRTVNRNR